METLTPAETQQAAMLLKRAVGTAARVVTRTNSISGYSVEIFRDSAPPVGLRLRPWRPGAAAEPETVWVLHKPSRRLLDELRERGQNFIALNGTVRVVAGGLILDRSNLPRTRAVGPLPRRVDPFADRNSMVARILLDEPGRRWGVREIAAAAGVSPGTVSLVVRALSGMGLVDFHRRGRGSEFWIDHPEPLLRRWSGAYSWERNPAAAFHAPMGDPERFVRRLPGLLGDTRWALTLQAGAAQVAPHAAWDRVHLYVQVQSPADLPAIGERLGWEPGADGRVVLMKPYHKTSVWHGLQQRNELPVVSDVQLMLDLWHYPLRGIEQAEHLLAIRGMGR